MRPLVHRPARLPWPFSMCHPSRMDGASEVGYWIGFAVVMRREIDELEEAQARGEWIGGGHVLAACFRAMRAQARPW